VSTYYTHTLTRVVKVTEVFIARAMYSPSRDDYAMTPGARVPEAELPVWERRHDTYADAVDAGMAMLAEYKQLEGFTVDKLIIRVVES
jgi:hypothetical protein